MLILLPPSEGKTPARRGRPLDLSELGFPGLRPARERVLEALVELCTFSPEGAAAALGLGVGQADLVARNAALLTATARADHVYSGVLYDALGLPTLSTAARRRAATRVAVVSSLFGLGLGPGDRCRPTDFSGDTTLPGVGPVAAAWGVHLGLAVRQALGSAGCRWMRRSTPPRSERRGGEPDLARRVVTLRVLHEVGGRRTVVSHFNKATKGRLVRDLLEDGARPGSVAALARTLDRLGWHAELGTATRAGTPVDVVVAEV